jgi:hypothetical protein
MTSDPWKGTALRKSTESISTNGGHLYGIQIGADCYYWADEVGTDSKGQLTWTCQYPDHVRRGSRGPEGEVILRYDKIL